MVDKLKLKQRVEATDKPNTEDRITLKDKYKQTD